MSRPRIRFVVTMAVFALVLWIVFRDSVMGPVLVPLRAITAETTLQLVRLVGLDGFRSASVIVHPNGFAMEISRGCTGFAGAAILAAGIVAYPATVYQKWIGLLVSLPIFLAVNLVRMMHLYYLGVVKSSFFHVAHTVVWQLGMMVTVFGLWFVWLVWSDRQRDVEHVTPRRSAWFPTTGLGHPLDR